MEEKDGAKNDLKDIFSSLLLNNNNKKDYFEKSMESYESCRLSTKIIKNSKDIQKEEEEIKVGNYLIKKTLGKGTFGKVKLALYVPRNKKVAIKILEKKRIKEEDDIKRLKREFEMLSQFNHPNVITISEIFESNEAYFTVMEYCEGGELFNYIVQNKYLSEEKSAFFFYQLISGLEYIHSLGIVHRDLKPENLLLTQEHILKIFDSGLSNYFKNDQIHLLETPCGSPCYASPEMLSGKNYDGFKIDIWATGIILFAMLCGYLPFDDKDNNVLFKKILECKINFPKYLSENAKDLLKKILVTNPVKRISIEEIKKHPFFLIGKKIFETNFTIYQVTAEDIVDSEDSSYFYDFKYMNENYFINNLLYYDSIKKSAKISNKLKKDKLFICEDIKKISLSYEYFNINNNNELIYEDKNKILKKLINLEKKLKKYKNNNKKSNEKEIPKNNDNNLIKEKDNLLLRKEKKDLKYNHSITFHIKDINNFVENLIIEYKIEEELSKKENMRKGNKNSHNNDNTIENEENKEKIKDKHNKSKTTEKSKEKKNNYQTKTKNSNKNKNKKNISDEKNKINSNSYRLSFLKNKKDENIKKNTENNNNFLKTQPNKNIIFMKKVNQIKKTNINKINTKKRESTKINKLFINNNKIIKINKLAKVPQSIKLKKPRRKIHSTSNNSKKKNFKNILNRIKAKSIKTNINLINKQNIIHHHITNITNMTQKNYFSNVIINNFKSQDDNKHNSTNKNKSKNIFDIPILKIDKILNIKLNVNQMKKQQNNNWKFKNNLQKLIIKDDNKNTVKYNTINNDEEIKKQNKSKKKKSKKISKEKEIESRTIPFQAKDNNNYKIKVSSINNYNIMNGYKMKKKKIFLNLDNSLRNSSINKDKIDKKEFYSKNLFEKKYKILLTDINFEEEIANRNKINYITSAENSYSNRSYNKNVINSFDKRRKSINNNISNRIWNKPGNKKIEDKKFNIKNIKNTIKNKKLNLKSIIGNNNNNLIKIEMNSKKNEYKINSQRNKSNIINNNKKIIGTNYYMNTARINDKKIINTSYNIGNNNHYIGNLTENIPPYSNNNNNYIFKTCKFKISQNNIRNKITLNKNYNYLNKYFILNKTNDNSKNNSFKNKSLLHSNNDLNSVLFKNINNNKNNKNIEDKFIISKKLLSSLRKRTNLKSMFINNIFDKKIGYKTQKNSVKKNKKNENKNTVNNNSVIINLPLNIKSIKVHNNADNIIKTSNKIFVKKKELIKFNTELYNSLNRDKKNHKKIKNMKDSINTKQKKNSKKINDHFKQLNVENNNNSIQ